MDKKIIIKRIGEYPNIGDVEEIEYKPEFLVVSFFYDFDEDEIEAAEDFAENQTDSNDETEFKENYITYLTDLSVDEVSDMLEEIAEEESLKVEYVSYELKEEDTSIEFVAVFADEGEEFDIDEVLDSIGI